MLLHAGRNRCWFAASVVLLLASENGSAAESEATAQQTLRWKFAPGQHLAVALTQTTSTETVIGEKPQRLVVKLAVHMRWQVDRVEADGTAHTTQSFQRLAAKTAGPDAPPAVFDSASKEPPAEDFKAFAEALPPLLGSKVRVTISPLGEITGVSPTPETESLLASVPPWAAFGRLFSTEGLRLTLGPSLGGLPEKPVQPGDTWTKSVERDTPQGRLRSVSTFTYDGRTPWQQQPAARISVVTETTLLDPAARPGVFDAVQPQPVKGVLHFDPAAGRLLHGEQTHTLKSKATYRNKTVEMTVTTTLVTTIAPEKAQPPWRGEP